MTWNSSPGELSANALRHTPSGDEGGWFAVHAIRATGWARIEVADQGSGRWVRLLAPPAEEEESGRGLSIVAALADRIGHDVTQAGQRLWAELRWPDQASRRTASSARSAAPSASTVSSNRARDEWLLGAVS